MTVRLSEPEASCKRTATLSSLLVELVSVTKVKEMLNKLKGSFYKARIGPPKTRNQKSKVLEKGSSLKRPPGSLKRTSSSEYQICSLTGRLQLA
ncbi:hypothetical protein MTR_2g445180 [Medicago truncatula]|uniref:Uncharacterized protein n=1 Tax=Medicago truncatula TaxID=3880 RepID=A0A072V7R7_MEDTR|nr:hypothetical protein MTR_2g445180 [Medicago truncatula]